MVSRQGLRPVKLLPFRAQWASAPTGEASQTGRATQGGGKGRAPGREEGVRKESWKQHFAFIAVYFQFSL